MNSGKSKTCDPRRLVLNLADKIDLTRSDKYFLNYQILVILYMEKYGKSYKNNKFEISAPTWNDEF